MIENRRTFRLPFRTKVLMGTAQFVRTGNAVNLSSGGLYVMSLEPYPRDTPVQMVFQLNPDEDPVCVNGHVKRVVHSSVNPEEIPGMGLTFLESERAVVQKIKNFMDENRKNFEMASTLLASGEPDLASLQPLLEKMHLPQFADLGELNFYIERILRTIELVEKNQPQLSPG